ncbi:MAG TPA: NAD(P)-dependent glycerol-3-phosphate dehydrogenase [Planctomycetes bacterium]|nr:NAD(P)-dependent glycerol-3-phosphate dehydrogenase [Planctomycetota bacterium]
MRKGVKSSAKICVLGNGGFGTALAIHAHRLGHEVSLWGHDPLYTQQVAESRKNPRYLPTAILPDGLIISSEARQVLEGADLVLFAVPTQHMREVGASLKSDFPEGAPVVSCAKGMEIGTGKLPTEILEEVLGPKPSLFALSGPCHAEEVVQGKPASLVVAGKEEERLPQIQELLSGPLFRLYRNPDPLGVELGGALKNIVAIAAGIADGLELGDNAKAALLTRGLHEMAVLGVALGARWETFYGLAGMGDLITTGVSPHGRNRALGERIGRGESLEQVLASTKKVSEGVWTCKSIRERIPELGVEMPISCEVYEVLFQGKAPQEAVRSLMTRLLREEKGGDGEERGSS